MVQDMDENQDMEPKDLSKIYINATMTEEFLPAFTDTTKYVCLKAGRRTGKTYNAMIWMLQQALKGDNVACLWVDTARRNIKNYIERFMKKILGYHWRYVRYSKTDLQVIFPNGSYIDFRSAERPEMMEGFEYDNVVLNEAGIIFENPSLWHNTVQPMCKNALVKIIGTPKGKNMFYELFHRTGREYASYSMSAYESPHWTHEQLDSLRGTMPASVWQQEYLAEFNIDGFDVFRNVDECVAEVPPPEPIMEDKDYAMSIDVAKHHDYTVIYIADIEKSQIIHQERYQGMDWTKQIERIMALWYKYHQPKTIIDSTGVGDPIVDQLRKQGLRNLQVFRFTAKSKEDLIHNLIHMMDSRSISYPPYAELLSELKTYTYTMNALGAYSYNAPAGMHDDCVISLALMAHVLRGYGTGPSLRWA